MINWRLLSKILGQLLGIEAVMLVVCLGMSVYCHGDDWLAFLFSLAVTCFVSGLMLHLGRNASAFMHRRDAYLIVTLTWVVFSALGSIPFVASGYVPSITDAFFETMSGFTTTGASLIDDVESLPHALLFWRSLTQWIGGLGIIFFTIAVIPSLIQGGLRVFSAEATGPMRNKLHPRLSTTAKWIWGIYVLLTAACAALFWAEGMGVFDAVNYAMTVTATGGFATHNDSTGYFHSPYIDYTAIAFMLLSGISFSLFYLTILKGRFRQFFRNSELRLFLFLIVAATIFIMLSLMRKCHYEFEDAFRSSLFQVVSFATTTGIFNDDAGQWPHITWVVLSVLMFFGGCSGSTAGGFKCVRGVMALEVMRNELRRVLHPRAVLPVRINKQPVPYSTQATLLAYFALYLMLCLVTYFIMILAGVDSTNSITIALSCASNVGPTLGLEIGPTMSWAVLPGLVKWLLTLLMLMGRLEIVSVVVLFTRSFWRDR
ncbi:MAG: TrkH family potassium uptake protein [Bacteroidaceae bacterium]|nr:TrkH family potassium uptake protein [Bacteroidaceae bacterium]